MLLIPLRNGAEGYDLGFIINLDKLSPAYTEFTESRTDLMVLHAP